MGYKIIGLNISIENGHLCGELARGHNRIYTKFGKTEFEVNLLVDHTEGNIFEGALDFAGDIYFVRDDVDKRDKFFDKTTHRSIYFDIYLNDIPIYRNCKMTHFDTLIHRGVQVAHFRAMGGIDMDKLLEVFANEEGQS